MGPPRRARGDAVLRGSPAHRRRPPHGPALTVERTPDGRYVVVDGRRWRATDPLVPEDVAARLRRELMAGRRAVKDALRAQDPDAERAARARVHAAKTALGERGTPWWDQTHAERRQRWEALLATLPDGPDRAAEQEPPGRQTFSGYNE